MELKYEVTEEDIIKGTLYNMKSSPEEKKDYCKVRYLLPIILGFILYNFNRLTSLDNKLFWAILSILFIIIWIIRFPKSYEKQIRKTLNKRREDDGRSPITFKNTIIIEEKNIKIISENLSNNISTEEIKKDNIKKVKVYDDMILIYKNKFIPQLVPTRHLNEESKIELLEKLEAK